jgi:pyruvate/2-oxoglutarate dehydrogenase complex dihydrolipoamide dehydrogenase (E3) component
VNYGCTPTKTLVASARVAHLARRAADYGVDTGDVQVDFARVMARKDAVVERFRDGLEKSLQDTPNITLIYSEAQFENANAVRAGDNVLEAEQIYINTGARAVLPNLPGLDSVPTLDNKTILQLKALPEHLILLGGGVISLEYAQIFRRFGSRVTILQRGGRLLDREDDDVSDGIRAVLEREGITVLVNAVVKQVSGREGEITVAAETDGTQRELHGTHLMVNAGRAPNTETLALERAGVRTDKRGYIAVDDHLCTNVPHIRALGDVNGKGAFTHTSYTEADIVLDNLNGGTRSLAGRVMAYAVYTDPPIGRVGMSLREARESGRSVLAATMPMSHVSRAIERDETDGLMRVLVDADTQRFLGATIFGIEGDEIIHTIVDLMNADAPCTVLRNAMHIHPTVSELLPTLVGELQPL